MTPFEPEDPGKKDADQKDVGETVPFALLEAGSVGGGALDAEALIEAAAPAAFRRDSRFYPGVRARAPDGYASALAAAAAAPVAEMMGWAEGTRAAPLASHFSLVTDPPGALSPLQRIPHVDGYEADVVAVLHYLCGPEHGGTRFYRHRATGFARITQARRAAFDASLDRDVARLGPPPPGYMGQRPGPFAEAFEVVGEATCAVGRIAAYPANALHCGHIPTDAVLSAVPARGRLTVNTFLRRA